MVMKSRILTTFATTIPDFYNSSAGEFYIMDYTNQTLKARGIECSNTAPTDIDAFIVNNLSLPLLDITFCVFKENSRIIGTTDNVPHCEGILFPTNDTDTTWITFLELKYPKKNNLAPELKEAREQLLLTLDLFREQGIIAEKRLVYLIFSAPKYNSKQGKYKPPFESWSISSEELKKIRKTKYAIMRGVNNIQVISVENIKV
jgi:hypothetical protein